MDEEKSDNLSLSEMKFVILEIRQQFHNKITDQSLLIRRQQDQLESHQDQIHNQRALIEELAWQIRDLRDTVRKCSEQISSVSHSKHHVNSVENHLKLNIPDANGANQSNHRAETSPIYESINIDSQLAKTREFLRNRANLPDQHHTIDIAPDDEVQKRNNERDVQEFLERCIPPPPVTSPPHDTDSDTDLDPVQISEQTLEKLNSLYSLYKIRRSASNECDELEDVVYRLRKFNDYTTRPFRGSSKAMCSFVSNVEDDYLPRLNEKDDDNGSANFVPNEIISKCSCDTIYEEICRQQQKPIYTQNDEVYI